MSSIKSINSKFNLINERVKYGTDGGINVDSGTLFVNPSNNRIGINTLSPSTTFDISGSLKSTTITDFSNSVGNNTQTLTKVNNQNVWTYPQFWLQGQNFLPSNTVDVSSIPTNASAVLKYIGSVLSPSGRIYCFPAGTNNVAIINPYNNTLDTTTISNITSAAYPVVGNATTDRWTGGVIYQDTAYAIPQASKAILKVNTTNNALSFIDISSLASVTYNWYGAALSTNNLIYGIPHGNTNVLVVNPVTDQVSTIPITGLQTGANLYYYTGGVLAPNGLIYGIPFDASSCLVIDPFTNTARADISGLGGLGLGGNKWLCGALGQDGKIYGIPFSSSNILVIDPITNTTSQIPSGIAGANRFYGGVLGMDGKIYCIPHRATSVLVIDTTRSPVVLSTIPNVNSNIDWWSGGVLSPEGKIYMTSARSSNFGIIETGLPTQQPWMLAPQFNKF